ncbi:MAG: BglI family type II restriction endonuclease [Chloroflexota bacterium]
MRPFWINYQPRQRGRSPIGNSIPWIEVAEKTVSSHIIRSLTLANLIGLEYLGLPLGGDVRFATEDVFIHFDVKATGSNDNPNEIVASPFQISGDGKSWRGDGFENLAVNVQRRGKDKDPMIFRPALPPFYVLEGRRLLCLTYFLKVNYIRDNAGEQILEYLELVSVPNGLLMFDGPQYHHNTKGLLIAGKDDKTVQDTNRRVRVRFEQLAGIGDWPRAMKIKWEDGNWYAQPHLAPLPNPILTKN